MYFYIYRSNPVFKSSLLGFTVCLLSSSRGNISILLVRGRRSEGKVWNKAAFRPSAHQLCSKVQTCHSVSSHLSKFTTGHWGSHTAAAAAVLVVGLGDPASFMHPNLLSSHWGKTLNDPLRRLHDSCVSLTFFSFHLKCHSFFFLCSQLVSLFLVFLLIFLFLIKPRVPSK